MENLFNSLTHYGSWTLENERKFNDAEISAVASATIVKSDWGKSVLFMMKSGGSCFVPVGRQSVDKVQVGQNVNIENMRLLRLSKPGSPSINRVEIDG